MKMYITLLIFMSWTASWSVYGAISSTNVRDELSRYTLLRDRTLLERQFNPNFPYEGQELYLPSRSSLFKLNINVSAGTKSLFSEMKEATSDPNPVQKNLQVMALLNRYINTERYLDLEATAGAPLPYVKIKKFRLLPHLFYKLNMSGSLSISNFGDVSNPRAQTYLKKETALGLDADYKYEEYQGNFKLYKMTRADAKDVVTYSDIVSDGKLVDFDTLNIDATAYALDFSMQKIIKNMRFMAEVKELTVKKNDVPIKYGFRPLFHANFVVDKEYWHYGAGMHYRRFYSLEHGVYVNAGVRKKGNPNLEFNTRLNNESVMLTPEMSWGMLHLVYGLKLQFKNPVDEMWVPATHVLLLEFLYPAF